MGVLLPEDKCEGPATFVGIKIEGVLHLPWRGCRRHCSSDLVRIGAVRIIDW